MGYGQNGDKPYNQTPIEKERETAPVFRPKLPESEPTKGTLAWYAWAYNKCEIPEASKDRMRAAVDRVTKGRNRYETVSSEIGCPWYFVGALHNMEATCSFAGVLHNGEKIIGTGKKTSLVPAGRGPFTTWEEAAIDALKLKGYQSVSDWSVANMLLLAEKYNGTGYLRHHPEENSPYLWANTNMNDGAGKYVADGKWSDDAPTNGQVGVAAIFKELERKGFLS